MNRLLPVFVVILLAGCDFAEKKRTPELFPGIENVHFLGHKGSGTFGEMGNPGIHDNSLEAVKNGLNLLNGVEIDLQLSKDTTLWLFHDHEIKTCAHSTVNFHLLQDEEIRKISACNYNNQLITVGELQAELSKLHAKNKSISLDLKVLQNPVALEAFITAENLAQNVMKALDFKSEFKEQFNIMVEIPDNAQLKAFEGFSAVRYKLCINTNCNTRPAVNQKAGLSVGLHIAARHPEVVSLFKENELPIQLWTVNSGAELKQALDLQPDYIQTDNLPLIRAAHQVQSRYREAYHQEHLSIENEFTEIYNKNQSTGQPFFVEVLFESPQTFPQDDLMLVLTGSKNDETILWKGIDVKQGKNEILEFINTRHLNFSGNSRLKFYFWKRGNSQVNISNIEVRLYQDFNQLE